MFWRRRRRDVDDFSEEIRAHLEHEEAELRRDGMSPKEARAEARRRFGNVALATERVYEAGRIRWLDALWQDVRYGLRLMRRSPAFSATAIVVLSLGIGVNTALFSIVDALFFKPLPVRAPQELFYLYTKNEAGQVMTTMNPELLDRMRELADLTSHQRRRIPFTADNDTSVLDGETVDANYFDLLGVRMELGRGFGPAEEDPANPGIALVISDDFWTRRFQRDPAVLGKKAKLNHVDVTIVGVAEPGFTGLADPWTPSQFWAPGYQTYVANVGRPPARGLYWGGGPIGRLKPGVTLAQVRALLATVVPEWRQAQVDRLRSSPNFERWRRSTMATSFPLYAATDTRLPFDPESQLIPTSLLVGMIAVVALVLLIASANIAGMLLARGVTRTGEVAVRRALGAGTARVSRQLLTESVLLSVAGGLLGVAVAVILVGLFRAFTPTAFAVDVGVDWRVLAFACAVCLGAGMLVGLAPALQAARVNVLQALGSGVVGARTVRARLRYWIVVPQVALSLVLLLVAAVHLRSLMRIETTDLGYRTENVTVLSIGRYPPDVPLSQRPRQTTDERNRAQEEQAAGVRTFNRTVLDRVRKVPGVTALAIADSLPVYSRAPDPAPVISLEDYDAGLSARATATGAIVSDGYFETLGMRLLAGRTFDGRDGVYEQFGPRVAVISEALARRLWPAGHAVGQTFAFLSDDANQKIDWLHVIGVVNEVDPVLNDIGDRPRAYLSLTQQWRGTARNLVVRSDGDLSVVLPALKAAVVGADAFAEVSQVRTLRQIVGEILFPRRIAVAILTTGGLIGLLLACIGLYGVVSYSVAQRVREIGIRAALGADRSDIIALVLGEGGRVAVVGILAGLGLALLSLRLTAGTVVDVPMFDPVSFIAMPMALAAVVVTACLLPARRAARVDPAQVLRGL
jgi:putative ABC transport system permease protein